MEESFQLTDTESFRGNNTCPWETERRIFLQLIVGKNASEKCVPGEFVLFKVFTNKEV